MVFAFFVLNKEKMNKSVNGVDLNSFRFAVNPLGRSFDLASLSGSCHSSQGTSVGSACSVNRKHDTGKCDDELASAGGRAGAAPLPL